ncbi:bifunctional glycoside hydrolase 114/ polysaccharide deacetylase family protein [Pseudomonas sp. 7P_10.2_Bac1]|uniref:bifunctional glycoside hydrolase 114/ polysaccharide deacetylase family protein n=1 Tax=Pseudomonas sp. 7P_10.2_Bac1 TaxID=2971614 RepID=UPI0021CADE66|nr:bifunctional glycoside hydrolase 114/ polysaccharide deacetylase family protein [Pseudomonas sp. 7P_10.2_Bac1]MCU1729656.1 bifunctional glycoside hydrolase 114/ polysaccharide deacetylase family protein [Pseudomonas sp. 7P_10.2_Bac1]
MEHPLLSKRVCNVALRLFAAISFFFTGTASHAAVPAPNSVGFWYADDPPLQELAQFDWVVVEPGHMSTADVQQIRKLGSLPFAYLSVGEFDGDQDALTELSLDKASSAKRNKSWGSQVMDLSSPQWRDYLFTRAHELKVQGYAGLFLDTLDSFNLLKESERPGQRTALASFLRELHQREPALKLFFNRGFEVLTEVDGVPAAVAVESIHAGWDAGAKRYRPVPQADRDWLKIHVQPLREKGVPIVAIDYLPPSQREQAKKLALQLRAEGYIPFVTTPDLDYLGISTVEVQPRRIAMLYDPREGDLTANSGHVMLGGLIEYLGYRIDYFAVDQPLPSYHFSGLYAGVVSWMSSGAPQDDQRFNRWVSQRLDENVPLAFFDGMPIENPVLLKRLGLRTSPFSGPTPLTLVSQDKSLVGSFEAPLALRSRGLTPLMVLPEGPKPALVVANAKGDQYVQVAIGQWGGIALNPYLVESNGEKNRWIIDPFAFVQRALRLPLQPHPDVTTENGRRIATVHLDGDGFPSRAEVRGTPYAGQAVHDLFIKPYPFLTSVSIIEGEISARGMFPFLAKELEPIARSIFADSKVEVATHTYSHPFFLQPEKSSHQEGFSAEYGLNIRIPGYNKIDFYREVVGSRDYINNKLTTPQKPVKMIFWPGDALPDAATIKIAYEAGLQNVNGGTTIITHANPSLTGLSPLLRPTEGGLQIYAPIINENMYTNLWRGPYYGFRDVIDTFELTDNPRRLRGLHLYYHFYSGTKQASIKVMNDIYAYMIKQQSISLWMSDYLPRVRGLYESSLARTVDGNWQVRGLNALRTLRIDPQMGWPDLSRSQGVAGVRDLPQGRYVHLSSDHALLALRPDRDPRPALEQANVPLQQWRYLDDRRVAFAFAGEFDIRFSVRATGPCRLEVKGQRFVGTPNKGLWSFKLPMKQVSDAQLLCN